MAVKKDSKYIGFYIPMAEYDELRELADIEQVATVNRLVRELCGKALRENKRQRKTAEAVPET